MSVASLVVGGLVDPSAVCIGICTDAIGRKTFMYRIGDYQVWADADRRIVSIVNRAKF